MKEMPMNSHGGDLIIRPPTAIALNPILSSPASILNNDDDLAASPPSAPLSDHQKPRRRDSRTLSFSTSASSLSNSPSSFLLSPYDSPFHSIIPYSSAVPFSWERQPGIPKSPDVTFPGTCGNEAKLLPPPPPLRSTIGHYRRKRSDAGDDDPFFAALSQCARDGSPANDVDAVGWRRSAGKSIGIWRRAMISDPIGLVSLYGSCKTACSVSDAIIVVPRSSRKAAGSYGRVKSTGQ